MGQGREATEVTMFHLAATTTGSGLIATVSTLLGQLANLGILVVAVAVGYISLRHLASGAVGAIIVLLGIAIIPFWIFGDPTGVAKTISSTIH